MKYLLDTKGLLCPMPVIRVQDKINQLQAGDTLQVDSTDPGTLHDIPAWCRINGHTVLFTEEINGIVTIVIEICAGKQ